LLKDSAAQFHALLLEDNWTQAGRAALLRELGDSYRYADEWEQAERAYREALQLGASDLDKVHLAECLLYRKQIEAASKEIDAVKRETLPRHEFEDFVFAYAAIAIWVGRVGAADRGKDLAPVIGDGRATVQ
jgi:uncharacterized protein HemY